MALLDEAEAVKKRKGESHQAIDKIIKYQTRLLTGPQSLLLFGIHDNQAHDTT